MSMEVIFLCDWCGKEDPMTNFRKLQLDHHFCCKEHKDAHREATAEARDLMKATFYRLRLNATGYNPAGDPIPKATT